MKNKVSVSKFTKIDKHEKKVLLIVNPNSGKKKGKSALFGVLDTFCKAGYEVTVKITAGKGDGKTFAASSDKYELVACLGGDGTLNEVISGVLSAKSSTPIGYIPTGTTNDFARSMKISFKTDTAAKNIVSGNSVPLDMGIVNGERYFAYIASFGLFTASSYKTPQAAKNTFGRFAYILEGMSDLIGNFKTHKVKVEADGKVTEDTYIFGAITNSTSIGGVVNLKSDLVNVSDGLFEVILIKNPKNVDELGKIINGLATSNFESNVFDFIKASSLKLTFNEACSFSLDGEEYSPGTELAVENLHKAVEFVV